MAKEDPRSTTGLCMQDGEGMEQMVLHGTIQHPASGVQGRTSLNFDVRSYQFSDLDLKIAVSQLPRQDRDILILHLMGHTQRDIGRVSGGITRSMISRRLHAIINRLARRLRSGI